MLRAAIKKLTNKRVFRSKISRKSFKSFALIMINLIFAGWAQAFEIQVTKTPASNSVNSGELVTYTMNVTNVGSQTFTSIEYEYGVIRQAGLSGIVNPDYSEFGGEGCFDSETITSTQLRVDGSCSTGASLLSPGGSAGLSFSFTSDSDATEIFLSIRCTNPNECSETAYSDITQFNPADPGSLSLTSSADVNEGDGSVTVTVERIGGSDGEVTAQVVTLGAFNDSSQTASGGQDYTPLTSSDLTLTWADGDSAPKQISVPILEDVEEESNETFRIRVRPLTGITQNDLFSQITIIDNDQVVTTGGLELPDSVSTNENQTTLTIPVSRINGSEGSINFNYTLAGSFENSTLTATKGEDFEDVSGQLTWTDTDTEAQNIVITITDDQIQEGTETFILSGTVQTDFDSYTISTTVEIIDNDSNTPVEQALKNIAGDDPQKIAVAESISKACPIAAPGQFKTDCDALVSAASSTDPDVNAAASKLLGEITVDDAGAASEISESGINTQKNNLFSRLGALRKGATGLDLSGFTLNIDGLALSESTLPSDLNPLETGGAAGDEENSLLANEKIGVFIGGTISLGDKDKTDNEDGFEFTTRGLTAGVDYRLNDQAVIGSAIGYSSTDTDIDSNGGEIDSDSLSLSVYGTYYRTDNYFIEGILSYAWNNFDQNRNISYQLVGQDAVNQTAYADYDGDQLSIALGTGMHINKGALTLTPTGKLEYIDTNIDSYGEKINGTGAGSGWGVALDDQNLDSMTLTLGINATYAISQNWGVLLPQASVEWVKEFEDDSRLVSGYFLGDQTQEKFILNMDEVDNSYFNLRLGVSGQFENGATGYAYYQRLIGYSNLSVDTIGLGFRWSF